MKDINAKSVQSVKAHTILICLCVACFLCILVMVLNEINSGGTLAKAIDDPIRHWFYGIRSQWLTALIRPFTHSCDWYFITGACIVLLIIPATRRNFGIPLAVGSVAVTLINNPIKLLVQRPRPDDITHLVVENGFSFPSGHAITSMCFYILLIVLLRRHIKNTALKNILTVLFVIPMIGIGLSRIYCGVHFPTDVFAGWTLGLAAATAVCLVFIRKQ